MTLIKQQANGLVYYHNPDWDIKHGFFTRIIHGDDGDSKDIYQGLNCGIGSADKADRVQANLKRVCDVFSTKEASLLYQYHSAQVIEVPFASDIPRTSDGRIKGDALIGKAHRDCKNLMGILTADCVPVLFYDRQSGITAAAHAGWKGAFAGVIENTITAMQHKGAQNIEAMIGPAIGQKSYQVGIEFYDNFVKRDTDYQQFFAPDTIVDNGAKQKYLFNLKSFVKHLLIQTGINVIKISPDDTCAQEVDYFSYRRSCLRGEPDYGRNISVIGF